jgi:hypothetical protein
MRSLDIVVVLNSIAILFAIASDDLRARHEMTRRGMVLICKYRHGGHGGHGDKVDQFHHVDVDAGNGIGSHPHRVGVPSACNSFY